MAMIAIVVLVLGSTLWSSISATMAASSSSDSTTSTTAAAAPGMKTTTTETYTWTPQRLADSVATANISTAKNDRPWVAQQKPVQRPLVTMGREQIPFDYVLPQLDDRNF